MEDNKIIDVEVVDGRAIEIPDTHEEMTESSGTDFSTENNEKSEFIQKKKKNWGTFLVALAGFLLLNEIVFKGKFHPFMFVANCFLVVFAIGSFKKRFYTGVFFPLAFIYILSHDKLGLGNLSGGFVLLIALLLCVGCSLICKKNDDNRINRDLHEHHEQYHKHFDMENGPEVSYDDSSFVNISSSFFAVNRKITSPELRQIDINTSFSGIKLDLTEAVNAASTVTVNLNASFSGTELIIPAGWLIDNRTGGFAAGIKEKGARPTGDSGVTLVLQGTMSFSGIDIIRV